MQTSMGIGPANSARISSRDNLHTVSARRGSWKPYRKIKPRICLFRILSALLLCLKNVRTSTHATLTSKGRGETETGLNLWVKISIGKITFKSLPTLKALENTKETRKQDQSSTFPVPSGFRSESPQLSKAKLVKAHLPITLLNNGVRPHVPDDTPDSQTVMVGKVKQLDVRSHISNDSH